MNNQFESQPAQGDPTNDGVPAFLTELLSMAWWELPYFGATVLRRYTN